MKAKQHQLRASAEPKPPLLGLTSPSGSRLPLHNACFGSQRPPPKTMFVTLGNEGAGRRRTDKCEGPWSAAGQGLQGRGSVETAFDQSPSTSWP